MVCIYEWIFEKFKQRSIGIFVLEAHRGRESGSQEWLYEVGGDGPGGLWTAMFHEVARASSIEKAKKDLGTYVEEHPEDHLARRLLNRLPLWQPRVGIELAERPDAPRTTPFSCAASVQLSLCDL
eukprot:GGOE01035482.1.p6 GENE.GGOE01035482.1~~GGOE01035482.1.p6  ORF type:complete len:125 (+),score=24.05 GGOE01035482.1:46-420(+)